MSRSRPHSATSPPRDLDRDLARHRVHHFLTDFNRLEKRYPGTFPRRIVAGDGAFLIDAEGRRLLDACQHLGACPIGHARDEMADAIADQVRVLEFCSLDEGHTHPWVVDLVERLAPLVPPDDPKFYFGSSGSEAIETAIKMARVYHARRGEPTRIKILARDGSYHGVGYGALSANGNAALREPFAPLVPGFVRVAQPLPGACGHCDRGESCRLGCADEIDAVIEREDPNTVAAFLAEPISMHGAVKVPAPDYWRRVRKACDRHGVLLIADEVVNGFGRTGRLFGSDHYRLEPDIAVVAKGLTSSYVPMGAAIAARHVADAFAENPFMHNATYSGHPVASVASMKTLEIIEREDLVEHAAAMEALIRDHLGQLESTVDAVFRTSAIGMLASAEWIVPEDADAADLVTAMSVAAYERNLLTRGFAAAGRGAMFFYPPLVTSEKDLRIGLDAFNEALAEQL